jgi:putative NIF3 family GTP cyclohydrolase 1 type 2
MGFLPHSQSPQLLARAVSEALHTPVKWVDGGSPVHTVALVSGSGGSFVRQAIEARVDCLLTGEAGHHDALDAAAAGLTLIAAGHFATEVCIVPVLAKRLQAAFPALNVQESQVEHDPFLYA